MQQCRHSKPGLFSMFSLIIITFYSVKHTIYRGSFSSR